MIATLENPMVGDVCTWCRQELSLTPRELVALRASGQLAPEILVALDQAGKREARAVMRQRHVLPAPRLDA